MYGRYKPFSKVFHVFNQKDDTPKLARRLNSERLMKAKHYLGSLNETILPYYSTTPNIVIVIVTVKRTAYDSSNLGYVLQTVAATHKLFVNDKAFLNKTMMICNVDLYPKNYTDVVSLKPYIPVVERYGVSSRISININKTRQTLYKNRYYSSKYDKETIDYMYCLEAAYSLGAKYVLLMEDDSIPMEPALDVLLNKIQYLDTKQDRQHYAYIKLYYPQRWQGYAYDVSRIIEIISIGCVGAGMVVFLHFILCKSRLYYVQVAYFLCGAWLFVLGAMIIGRQNVFEFYRISKYLYTLKSSPGCCTQAMLYTRQFIPPIIEFLSAKHKNLHTDLAIYNFTNVTGVRAYQIEPNLFYHVGMYTSLTTNKHKNAEEFIFHAM